MFNKIEGSCVTLCLALADIVKSPSAKIRLSVVNRTSHRFRPETWAPRRLHFAMAARTRSKGTARGRGRLPSLLNAQSLAISWTEQL